MEESFAVCGSFGLGCSDVQDAVLTSATWAMATAAVAARRHVPTVIRYAWSSLWRGAQPAAGGRWSSGTMRRVGPVLRRKAEAGSSASASRVTFLFLSAMSFNDRLNIYARLVMKLVYACARTCYLLMDCCCM